MIRIRDISLRPGEGMTQLLKAASAQLKCTPKDILRFQIVKRSVDARKKDDIRVIYTVDVAVRGSEEAYLARAKSGKVTAAEYRPYRIPIPEVIPETRPVVVGFGPAGMFAALLLAEVGLRPIVLERGSDVDRRHEAVRKFWETGELDEHCNVQFGEGGAGTFSDGKLNTGTKNERNGYVLQRLADFSADESILYDAKPHIGTDVLRKVVKNLRAHILSLGADVRFETQMTGIGTENGRLASVNCVRDGREETVFCENAILALGHSARDSFEMLYRSGLSMEPKAFSMGVRIEQRQSEINKSQYGRFAGHPALPNADYKLNCSLPDGSSAYTFCMCPGGYVVAAASEQGGVVTNGMSYSGRDGENANAALLVTLKPEDFPYAGVFGGMRWQREIEQRAFRVGGGTYRAPAQLVSDFLEHRPSEKAGSIKPTYQPGVTFCDLHDVLPERITHTLEQALPILDRQVRGFAEPDAVLTAPETRSSSPVRILRGDDLQSSVAGIFPSGEGAGYAGGILSAAVDGLRCAEALIASISAENGK